MRAMRCRGITSASRWHRSNSLRCCTDMSQRSTDPGQEHSTGDRKLDVYLRCQRRKTGVNLRPAMRTKTLERAAEHEPPESPQPREPERIRELDQRMNKRLQKTESNADASARLAELRRDYE